MMNTRYTFFIALFMLLSTVACQRTDFDEIMRKQQQQQDQLDSQAARIAALEAAVKLINTDITSLKAITTALQQKVSITSYKQTDTGYLLSMSDGTSITLANGKNGTNGTNGTNGKDGINPPAIGVKQDTDGIYYWTLGDSFIIQNGNKLRVTGKDGQNGSNGSNGTNGANGTDGITPLLQVNIAANQWMISYDNGNSWQIVRDASGNPVPATGPSGPQGPSGISGFSIEEGDGIITITYQGIT